MTSRNDAEVEKLLRHIASVAVDDPVAADALLWDWIGHTPTPAGEVRMRDLALLAPRLVADEVNRAGWGGQGGDMWALTRPLGEELPPAVEAASQAVIRHLNGEPDVADEIVDAYAGPRGVAGLWDVGTASLRLLAAELRDQRSDHQ